MSRPAILRDMYLLEDPINMNGSIMANSMNFKYGIRPFLKLKSDNICARDFLALKMAFLHTIALTIRLEPH